MKPQLPLCIAALLPDDIVRHIDSFVPHLPVKKKTPPRYPCTVSPNMERDLRMIQNKLFKGKNEMYLRELDDFILI